jgi:hypothetical protein
VIDQDFETSAKVGRAKARPDFRPRIGWAKASLICFLLGFSSGCYTYTPLTSAPVPGSTVSFLVTDQGRVGLGPTAGPSADRLEGVVESVNDSAYVLRVKSVTYLNGQMNQWSNEQLVVGKSFVTNLRERKFSRSRTALVSVAAAAAVFGFIWSRGLFGLGSESSRGKGEPPGDGNQ